MSLTLLSFYGIGTILGAGIYVLVGKVAGIAGMAAPFAFLLAGILVLFSAFSYAELSSRFPKSAGEAIYVQEGLGLTPLAIAVGLLIVSIGVVSTGTLVHGFVGYLQVFLPWPDTAIIVALMLAMTALVGWGIRQSALAASLMTLVELFGLLLVLWVARDAFGELPARAGDMLPTLDVTVWAGILAGSFISFYAFIGFEDIVNVAEEVDEPERNLPRAIFIAWFVTTLLYLAVSTVSVLALPSVELAESDAPLALLYERLTGRAPVVLTVISLVSVLNGALIQLIMASRVLYGMSRRGWLPACFGRVNRHTRTPLVATMAIAAVTLAMALWLPLLSLAKLSSLVTLTVFTLVNLSLWQVKRHRPAAPGWSTPYWVPVAGFLVTLTFTLYQFIGWVTG
jgi:amino acid transporter